MAIASISIESEYKFSIYHDSNCIRLVLHDLTIDVSYPMWMSVLSASSELCRTNYLEPEIACDK